MPWRLNVKHWLDHADEARAIAGQMNDPEAKQTMLGIAKGYEHMAKLAEEQLAKSRTAAALRP
jgi:hypothetical protein